MSCAIRHCEKETPVFCVVSLGKYELQDFLALFSSPSISPHSPSTRVVVLEPQ